MHVLLNWLAQGVILALAAAAGLAVIPRSRTQARYGFVWAAYLSLLVLPAVAPILTLALDVPRIDVAPTSAAPLVTVPVVWWTSATVAIGLWIVWFGIHAIALGRGVAAVHDAKRRADACPRDLLARLPHWSRVSATGRPTRVVLSNCVRAAGVLGCGTPVIAIAPRLVEQLSPADLDRVLVHEWAHVQRRDDLARFVQRLARTIVGWHPAAWWFERRLEFEREVACDEIAVGVTGSAKPYAECLVLIAALQRPPVRSVPVLAAVSRSRLHQRVARIVAVPCAVVARPWRALVISGALGLAACALAVGNVHVVTSAGAPVVVITAAPASARAAATATPATLTSMETTASVSSSVLAGNRRPRASVAVRENGAAQGAGKTHAIEELSTSPIASLPGPSLGGPPSATAFVPVAGPPSDALATAMDETPAPALKDLPGEASAGWTRAADAGVAIGRASQAAGVATAGFFRRFGKKVADSF